MRRGGDWTGAGSWCQSAGLAAAAAAAGCWLLVCLPCVACERSTHSLTHSLLLMQQKQDDGDWARAGLDGRHTGGCWCLRSHCSMPHCLQDPTHTIPPSSSPPSPVVVLMEEEIVVVVAVVVEEGEEGGQGGGDEEGGRGRG